MCDPEKQELKSDVRILDFVTSNMMWIWGTNGGVPRSWLLKESKTEKRVENLANWVNNLNSY